MLVLWLRIPWLPFGAVYRLPLKVLGEEGHTNSTSALKRKEVCLSFTKEPFTISVIRFLMNARDNVSVRVLGCLFNPVAIAGKRVFYAVFFFIRFHRLSKLNQSNFLTSLASLLRSTETFSFTVPASFLTSR